MRIPTAQLRVYPLRRTASYGFTIVELVVVVVIVAILATVSVFAYGALTKDAAKSTLKSDLVSAAAQLQSDRHRVGAYPGAIDALKKSDGTIFDYQTRGDAFCLEASNLDLPGINFHITASGRVEDGACGRLTAATMQEFTTEDCSSLGPGEIITLVDVRAGQRSYQVARLADDNCWMLSNLRLGSKTGPISLTSTDSNVKPVGGFLLPQLNDGTRSVDNSTAPTNDSDAPYTYYDPMGPGDVELGSAQDYGYYYNFSAATAGETRASLPDGATAEYDICPRNWRLPIGGAAGEFMVLNSKMSNRSTTSMYIGSEDYQNWQFTGPFRGVFSGFWSEGFYTQGEYGRLWTGTAGTSSGTAFYAYFTIDSVYPGVHYYPRRAGSAIRCLLGAV